METIGMSYTPADDFDQLWLALDAQQFAEFFAADPHQLVVG